MIVGIDMVVEAEVVLHQSIQVLDVQYRCIGKGNNIQKDIVDLSSVSSPIFKQIVGSDSVSNDISRSEVDVSSPEILPDADFKSAILQFIPKIRSGSFASIGPRQVMEDEHVRIDDLSTQLGSLFRFPTPSAFYGVFDGHGGPEAAAYMRKNAMRYFFEDADFPQTSEANTNDDVFLKEVENSIRKAFLQADVDLAEDCTIGTSSGTTALTALVLGRLLLVANAGDCRAVLCRKGEAIEMSQDHRPVYPSERRRVEELGGFIDDYGYLNAVLSVSRALGDWELKLPQGSRSPLIPDPEFRRVVLTEDDEFLIIGCDGIWDVMSSQHAVSLVRRGLRRHDDPEQSARDLVMEALRLDTFDNLTVIVVCFSSPRPPRSRKLKCFSLSAEALCNLKSFLEDGH